MAVAYVHTLALACDSHSHTCTLTNGIAKARLGGWVVAERRASNAHGKKCVASGQRGLEVSPKVSRSLAPKVSRSLGL